LLAVIFLIAFLINADGSSTGHLETLLQGMQGWLHWLPSGTYSHMQHLATQTHKACVSRNPYTTFIVELEENFKLIKEQ